MSTSHRSRLRRRFEDELLRDVRLHLRVHAGACVPCCLTKELIEEIASLSPRLSSKIVTDGGAVPEIRLDGNARGQIGFTGLPSGYELPAFIDSILDVSRGTTSLTEVARKRLSRLRKPVRIQVFTTPTWIFCPQVSRLAHQIAVESEHVAADVVEIESLPELAERYHVTGVPKVLVNETVELLGSQSEESLLDAIGVPDWKPHLGWRTVWSTSVERYD